MAGRCTKGLVILTVAVQLRQVSTAWYKALLKARTRSADYLVSDAIVSTVPTSAPFE